MIFERILHLENISKSFRNEIGVDIPVLKNITLDLNEKEFVSILAPKNSGKTTLLRIASNLERYDSGKIEALPNQKIFYFPSTPPTFPWLDLRDNLLYKKYRVRHLKGPDDLDLRRDLSEVGLDTFEDLYSLKDSETVKFRITLMKIIRNKVNLLFMDESFSTVREEDRFVIYNLFKSIQKRQKISVLLVTNNITEALCLSDRIYLMTKNPARFIDEIKLNFECESCVDILAEKDFYDIRKNICEFYRTYDYHYAYRFTI